jgi:hypothetical protein
MFIDFSSAGTRAEQHRHDLLVDAEQHRLAATARAGRRAAQQAVDDAVRRMVGRSPAAPPATAGHESAPSGQAADKLGGNRR